MRFRGDAHRFTNTFFGDGGELRNSFGPVVGSRRVRPTIAKRVFRVDFVTEDKTAKLTFPCNGKIRLQIKYLYAVPTGNTILPTPRGKRGIFLSHVFAVFFWSESPGHGGHSAFGHRFVGMIRSPPYEIPGRGG